MDMRYYPLLAEDGTVVGVGAVSQGHDMTEFKIMEDELREANATKDTFFSIIAHDLKNPLIALQSGARMLAEDFQDSEDAEIREISGELYKRSNQVYELLEQLLTWARSQQGTLPYHPMPLSLHALSHYVAELVRNQSDDKDLTIQCLAAEDAQAHADLNMVETVFRNLLSNAIKFTDRGGAITIDASDAGEMVAVSVSDTGVGMPESKRQRLFRIGEQNISSAGTAGERGTGLGLILCKEFINRHGGDIWVESEEGQGSTFTFTLPKAAC
jgi:signal transduction histidine kinase